MPIDLNVNPLRIDLLNDLPIKVVGGTVIHIRDVAQVRDGYMPQENIVRQDGVRSTLTSVQEWQRLYALRCGRGEGSHGQDSHDRDKRRASKAIRGSIHIREGRGQRSGPRRCDRGMPDGLMLFSFSAPGAPRSLRCLDPALDPDIARGPQCVRANDQHDDARRPGSAVGILVDDATVELLKTSTAKWRSVKPISSAILDGAQRNRLAGNRFDALHLHSFRSDVLPQWGLALSVRANGRGRGVRAAGDYGLSRTLVPTMVMWFYRDKPYRGEAPDPATEKPCFAALR